jgi:hypothetical protein
MLPPHSSENEFANSIEFWISEGPVLNFITLFKDII